MLQCDILIHAEYQTSCYVVVTSNTNALKAGSGVYQITLKAASMIHLSYINFMVSIKRRRE